VWQENCSRKSVVGKLWQKNCGRKIVAGKVRQKKCGRKSATEKLWQEKCGRKSVVGKVWQKKCGRKIVAGKVWQEKCSKKSVTKNHGNGFAVEKPRQQNSATRKKGYGFHMCTVEFMNEVEGLPCKYVGCPLESLWLVVELI
jgi:hypothetical protein